MPSYSDRMYRLSVVYALCGLLFAGIAAGLIVATARPVFHAVVVVPIEGIKPVTVGWIRGSRRLMETTNEVRPFVAEEEKSTFDLNIRSPTWLALLD